ncbi:hypothetical protein [Nostoc sp. LEGE 12450]|uniref:hypothetical protein n=1 Tax=Nostoc sp. LEGE 12450 TaxID=1828643 RepID=UPI001881BEEC|nr:hypothetical protein [Nostoc sp. LEGE 12450]MBE8990626.1 hypothetical protein [Nostoc sp. LEGE 12450]
MILAIDGMQPEIGHEVLWVIRDCLSGEILLAKTLLSSRNEDLVALLLEVTNTLNVPIDGVISDGQQSIRKAVRLALPSIAHGLCHYHYHCMGHKETGVGIQKSATIAAHCIATVPRIIQQKLIQ